MKPTSVGLFLIKQLLTPQAATPRNVIVQWEAPRVNVRKAVKYLGVIRANPAEYEKNYSSSLLHHTNLPKFVKDIKTPLEIGILAADTTKNSLELEGDLEGFLDNEGLSEYRQGLLSKGIRFLDNRPRSSVESYTITKYKKIIFNNGSIGNNRGNDRVN